MYLDHVFPAHGWPHRESVDQTACWIRSLRLCLHGNLLLRSMVSALSQLLVRLTTSSLASLHANIPNRAVPTPNVQCNTALHHLITNAVFNISSDVIMICIALPMFIRSQLPLRKKVVLVCIFSLGLFVILSSILNKYYSFTSPFGSMWTYWYTRESSTAILVANLPFLWPLVRRVFKVRSLDATTRSNSSTPLTSFGRQRSALPLHQCGIDPVTGRKLSDGAATPGTSTSSTRGNDVESGLQRKMTSKLEYDIDTMALPEEPARVHSSWLRD